jgi:cbb3-type cytochrome oxidase maturation protein
MTLAYFAEFGVAILFGVTAIWALAWAIRSGQFADFGRGAASIFDEEEPVGRPTDTILKPADSPDAEGGSTCQH